MTTHRDLAYHLQNVADSSYNNWGRGGHAGPHWMEVILIPLFEYGVPIGLVLGFISTLNEVRLSRAQVGPEASVFDVLVTLAGILLLAKIYPRAKYAVVERQSTALAGPQSVSPAL